MTLAVTDAELRRVLAQASFVDQFGFELDSFADGECTLLVPFRKALERPGGIVSGQVFMAASDVAMWLAIKTKLGMAEESVTAEMKTNFLSAARHEDFHCTARVLKVGRRLIYGTAECVGANGRMFTHSTLTYIRAD